MDYDLLPGPARHQAKPAVLAGLSWLATLGVLGLEEAQAVERAEIGGATMFNSILAGAALIVLTVVVHAAFMTTGLPFLTRRALSSGNWMSRHYSFLIAFTVLWFSVAHLVEIALWAACYLFFKQFSTVEAALYFSAVTFTTLGYGDVVLDEAWRLLSSFEAINGIILVGWTTAIIIGVSRHGFAGNPVKSDETP